MMIIVSDNVATGMLVRLLGQGSDQRDHAFLGTAGDRADLEAQAGR